MFKLPHLMAKYINIGEPGAEFILSTPNVMEHFHWALMLNVTGRVQQVYDQLYTQNVNRITLNRYILLPN